MVEGNYLISLPTMLMNCPIGADDELQSDASEQFFLTSSAASACDGREDGAGLFHGENEFHICTTGQTVSAPELGLSTPAFDDRQPISQCTVLLPRPPIPSGVIDAVFHTEAHVRPGAEGDVESGCEDIEDECPSIDQSVHGGCRRKSNSTRRAGNRSLWISPQRRSVGFWKTAAFLRSGPRCFRISATSGLAAAPPSARKILSTASALKSARRTLPSQCPRPRAIWWRRGSSTVESTS